MSKVEVFKFATHNSNKRGLLNLEMSASLAEVAMTPIPLTRQPADSKCEIGVDAILDFWRLA